MKIFSGSLAVLLVIILLSGCGGKGVSKKEISAGHDTVTVKDTGFTGIKQYMSGTHIAREVTFKNGLKDGLTKNFYISGRVRQTFWYENGLKQDSSRWYFEEGQLFRTTPYKNDTIDGIQKQFYRTGKVKAKIGYKKGFRTLFFEEYTPEGKLVGGYPQVINNLKDEYQPKGVFKISMELSDKSSNVRFYRGDFSGGVFDTTRFKKIVTLKGIGSLDLRKTGSPTSDNVETIAEILTNFGNKLLVYKKIELPYKDLN